MRERTSPCGTFGRSIRRRRQPLVDQSLDRNAFIPALGVRFEHSAPPSSRMSFAGLLKRAAQAAGRSISTSAARAHGDAPVRSLEPSQPSWTPSRHRAGAALLAARARSPRCSRRCSLSHSAATAQHYVHAPNMYEVTKVRRGTEKSGLCDTVLPLGALLRVLQLARAALWLCSSASLGCGARVVCLDGACGGPSAPGFLNQARSSRAVC